MFKLKTVAAAAGLMVLSGSALAGATGNVGAYSEYMFRGVEQTNGPAVQGGLDYSHDSGLYVGTWLSNTNFAGTGGATVRSEVDGYVGFTKTVGSVAFDVGALYYYYTDTEAFNTIEYYAGATIGAASAKIYFTEDYFGTDEKGTYITASYGLAVSDSLKLTPQVGFSEGNGPQAFVVSAFDPAGADEHYVDYSLTLAKTLDAGFTFSFAVIGSDLKGDNEKVVVGLKKSFDL